MHSFSLDPRSKAERLSDLFSALSRQELGEAAKREQGEAILREQDVPAEEWSVWLEAL
jgi:hypothetical protein